MAAKKKPDETQRTGFAPIVEVANYLNVSKHTVYRAVNSKQLPVTRIGGSIRIKWEDVYALHGRNAG